MDEMHRYTNATAQTEAAIVAYATSRLALDPPPLDRPETPETLAERVGATVTARGLGASEALRIYREHLAPAMISTDHPLFLAFVPAAPTKASVLFDLVVSASSTVGSTWMEAAGGVYAENQALRWLADLAGLPGSAGGTFVSGGSAANLSGLVAARHTAEVGRRAEGRTQRPSRWLIAAVDEAHSSIRSAARIMDADILAVPADERGRLTGPNLRAALDAAPPDALDGSFAVVATAGTTNVGIVDDLAGVADVCGERGLWFHVDAAYGGAALAAPSARPLFEGIDRADTLVIDPHKWLFAPYDCAALLYRDPSLGAQAHTQEAAYLDDVNISGAWNPTHYAYHLTRRLRGLPFWFSLAVHGTDAYRDAVEHVLALTRAVAAAIRERPQLELLLEPELSTVVFRRRGWSGHDYAAWSQRLLDEQRAFVLPSTWKGERVMRLCFVNPLTTVEQVTALLDAMPEPSRG
jgi:glutamate/tyrosine decarboxylase-like PLP-dependent enzyme